jgi:uncharacterized membrane protein
MRRGSQRGETATKMERGVTMPDSKETLLPDFILVVTLKLFQLFMGVLVETASQLDRYVS